jgi:hypothetical protein
LHFFYRKSIAGGNFKLVDWGKILVKHSTRLILIALMAFSMPTGAFSADNLAERAMDSVKKGVDIRKETQKNEARWFEDKKKLVAEYTSLEAEFESLTNEEIELVDAINQLQVNISDLETSLKDIEEIASDLDPFLQATVVEIDALVENNFPMLLDERKNRIAALKTLVQSSEITVSEKFRKTMETLFVEASYGNTVEVYQEKVSLGGETILADIFRLGRVSLFCITPDGNLTGFYDRAKESWQPLPVSYNSEIAKAVEMGTKRRAMDFLTLPLGRMVAQ